MRQGRVEQIQRAPEAAADRELASRHPLHILLAEDNAVNQKLALRLLANMGYVAEVANDGAQAIAALEAIEYDTVLMDVQMPELDGNQATVAIRERESRVGGHVPIIAMTAHAMKGDREECLAAGMDGYVAKPVNRRELLRVIDEVVGTKAKHCAQPGKKGATKYSVLASKNFEHALSAVEGDVAAREAVAGSCEKAAAHLDLELQLVLEPLAAEAALVALPRRVLEVAVEGEEAGRRPDRSITAVADVVGQSQAVGQANVLGRVEEGGVPLVSRPHVALGRAGALGVEGLEEPAGHVVVDVDGSLVRPGSIEELERRLVGRGTDSSSAIARRLEVARREIAQADWYQHQVINDDVDQAVDEIVKILLSYGV